MAGKRVETNSAAVPLGSVVATVVRFAVNAARLTVQAGTTVTWINIDDAPHQFLVEGAASKTGQTLKGQTATVIAKEPGVYHYRDTFYPAVESLKGALEVRK
jgi:plastocyanin